jgi:hypothetical protein
VTVAPDGSLWALSTVPTGANKFIWHYANQTWSNITGLASSIAVAPNGVLYGVGSGGGLYSYNGTTWSTLGGGAKWVTTGADGAVYVLSNATIDPNGDATIWKYANSIFTQQPGAGVELTGSFDAQAYVLPGVGTVAPNGYLVINATGGAYYYSPGSGYVQFPGLADATAAATGGVFALGYPSSPDGEQLYYFDYTSALWTSEPGIGIGLATGAGRIYVVSSTGAIWTSLTGQPAVTLDTPPAGATQLSGNAYNVDPSTIKVVIYALTNEWYVQPTVAAPFTNISANGSWSSPVNPWSSVVVLLVNPANYTPEPTEITNPALDPGVLGWTEYPSTGPISVEFGGYEWGLKQSGTAPGDQFMPGPDYWTNSPSVVSVASDGLHLKTDEINGLWECGEVYLLRSLGYGTYTVQVSSHLDELDQETVAAPLFIYAGTNEEIDNEYSGLGGLIPSPYDAQFVVQPYTNPNNLFRYQQPSTAQFTTQMQWQANSVIFTSWNGWANAPTASTLIAQWTYGGAALPAPGPERVHLNLWLNGAAPLSGTGDEMVLNSFTFQP